MSARDDFYQWRIAMAKAKGTEPEFDPAWVCGVCGKRHGRGQCSLPGYEKPRHWSETAARRGWLDEEDVR